MEIFFVVLFGSIGAMALNAWRSRKHAQGGNYDCALRLVGSKHWEHGQARVAPGVLMFRRTAGRGGMRLGVRATPARRIEVASVDASERRPSGREAWGMNLRASVFRHSTSEGELDWALVAPDAKSVVRALRGGVG